MKSAMIDLNVVLDVAQKRVPHFAASAQVMAGARQGVYEGLLIVTRNIADFDRAPIQTLTPEEFLAALELPGTT